MTLQQTNRTCSTLIPAIILLFFIAGVAHADIATGISDVFSIDVTRMDRAWADSPAFCVRMQGDSNCDCVLNILDLLYVRNRLGQGVSPGETWLADANRDGRINILDLLYVRNRLGTKCQ